MGSRIPMTSSVESLLDAMQRLSEDQESADICFLLGRDEERVYAHRIILAVRCRSFQPLQQQQQPAPIGGLSGPAAGSAATAFEVCRIPGGTVTAAAAPGALVTVRLPHVQRDVFKQFIFYVYTGKIMMQDARVFEMMTLAEDLGVDELKSACEDHVISTMSVVNACTFLTAVMDIQEKMADAKYAASIMDRCITFIGENAAECVKTTSFVNLTKDGLIKLISSDYFCLEEEDVWRCVLSWAKHQASVHQPTAHWSEEERALVCQHLAGVMGHVRLLLIDSQVFAEEVEPTGAVPMELSLERYRHAALQTSKAAAAAAAAAAASVPPATGGFGGHYGQHQQQQQQQQQSHYQQQQQPQHHYQQQQQQSHHHQPQYHMSATSNSNSLSAYGGGHSALHPAPAPPLDGAGDKRLQPRVLLNQFPGSGILKSDRLHLQAVLNGWYGVPKQAWRQLYRGSVHGFAAAAFHARCDGVAPTMVLVQGSRGEISGGFNDVPWSRTSHKGGYIHSERAFLFALGRAGQQQQQQGQQGQSLPDGAPMKYDIVKKPYAICYHADCGPIFGAGADLLISSNCNTNTDSYSNLPHSYDGPGASCSSLLGDYNFLVTDYEVYTTAGAPGGGGSAGGGTAAGLQPPGPLAAKAKHDRF